MNERVMAPAGDAEAFDRKETLKIRLIRCSICDHSGGTLVKDGDQYRCKDGCAVQLSKALAKIVGSRKGRRR